jgi:hypothetical protein
VNLVFLIFVIFLLSATHALYCATIQLFVGWGDVGREGVRVRRDGRFHHARSLRYTLRRLEYGCHCPVGCVIGSQPPQEHAGRGFLSGSMSESRRAR